jgi:hypothetical protein
MMPRIPYMPVTIGLLSALLSIAPERAAHASSLEGVPDQESRSTTTAASEAPAQRQNPSPRPSAPRRPGIGVDFFAQVGNTSFTASESFEAILDSSSGSVFGGGGQIRLPFNLFARIDVSRFRRDGERVFVSSGDVFKLGIPTTITVTPIEITGGYRHELSFGRRTKGASAFRLVPFGGGGAGRLQYKERADFSIAGDDVEESFTSYHVIGGVEAPIWRWIGAGFEYQHRWVPDAIGHGGVSAEFNEDDLGGGTFRVRLIVSF